MDPEKEKLCAIAHYAGDGVSPADSLERFSAGGGLIERCIATRQPILIDNPPPDYLSIRSGLGSCTPSAILIFPIMQVERLCAILELATLQPLDEDHQRLLADIAPLIALSLDIQNQRMR
jgi:GAF domain-containing protein